MLCSEKNRVINMEKTEIKDFSENEKNKVEVPKTENFTERLASGVIVSYGPDEMFLIDFLKPEISVYADETGKILGHKGQLSIDVRIFMSPKVAEDLLKALKNSLERYYKNNNQKIEKM